jgi:hypothetical protein
MLSLSFTFGRAHAGYDPQVPVSGELKREIALKIAKKLRTLLASSNEGDEKEALDLLIGKSPSENKKLPLDVATYILDFLRENEVKKLSKLNHPSMREYVHHYFTNKIYRTTDGKQQLGYLTQELIDSPDCMIDQFNWIGNLPYKEIHLECHRPPEQADLVAQIFAQQENLVSLSLSGGLSSASSHMEQFRKLRSIYLKELHLELDTLSRSDLLSIQSQFPRLEILKLEGIQVIGPEALEVLKDWPFLREVQLGVKSTWNILTKRHISDLAQIPHLESFIILGKASMPWQKSHQLLGGLARVTHLKRLGLHGAQLKEIEFLKIRKLLHLEYLDLSQVYFNPFHLKHLRNHPTLKILDLRSSSFFDNLSVAYSIPDLPALEALYIHRYDYPYFSDSLQKLGSLSHLKEMSIAFWIFSEQDLQTLVQLFPYLEKLTLSGVVSSGQGKLLQTLNQLQHLKSLTLEISDPVRSLDISEISKVRSLYYLSILETTEIDHDAAYDLSQSRTLEVLKTGAPATSHMSWFFRQGKAPLKFLQVSDITGVISANNLKTIPGLERLTITEPDDFFPGLFTSFRLGI